MTLQEKAAGAEVFPLRRADLDQVFAVPDRRLPHERNRVESATHPGNFEPIVRIQRGVVAERLHEIPGADVPATPQRRVAIEMQLLVLDVPAVDEVLILPDPIHQDVAGKPLEERARFAVGRVAGIDVRMHDAGAPDEPARRAEIVRDTGEHAAESPDPMLHRELREPQRRRRRDTTRPRAAPRHLQVQSIDVIEDQPAVHFGHAVVIPAVDAVGVEHADARSMP